ncbi:asparagine synthetase B [Escherichia coli]|uniref:Asparagine synthetase B n=1 Tax=Escherichia coli TaxID=562 RepID=A0A376RNX5_ECOLX|nr:asparagine synthetase B [Escherichia coli]
MCLTVCCFWWSGFLNYFRYHQEIRTRRVEDQERSEAWWPQLHSFAVGLPGSPDLKAAQEVANHLGTVHHEIHFTVQEVWMPSAT